MLDQEDWRCPTCLDLLYKPSCNSACGHLYCFWCLHKAMSPYTPSACPVCRTKYRNLPAICAKLHRFLSVQFPEAYAERRRETEAEEQESGGASPEPDAGPLQSPAGPDQWALDHFACDNPRCGKLLCRPAVLNCGHVVCQPTCLGVSDSKGQAAVAAGVAGASPTASPIASPSASPGPVHGGAVAGHYECPACGMAARQPPAVCKQLGDLITQLFPADSQQREREVEEQLAVAAAAVAAAGGGCSSSREPLAAEQQQPAALLQQQGVEGEREEPATPHASAAPSEGGPSATAGGDDNESPPAGTEQQQQQAGGGGPGGAQAQNSSLWSALRRRQEGGGRDAALARRLEENLRSLTGEEYVHHGVGCDACGMYPIQGRRFQCSDCPEAMGFDLCGDCMDRGVSDIVGRFNQRHMPEHRMHLVRPRLTAMHMLQAANPELPMEQLLYLLELTLHGDDDEQQQLPPLPPQQQLGDASSSGAGEVEFSGLRRGPRPAHDPAAQDPSPSAYAPVGSLIQQAQQAYAGLPPAAQNAARQVPLLPLPPGLGGPAGSAPGLLPPQPTLLQHASGAQQQQAGEGLAAGGEAAGLIDDSAEDEDSREVATVTVPLERLLPPRTHGSPAS